MNFVLTNEINTIPSNVSRNSDGKKVRYKMACNILYAVSSVIIFAIHNS